MPKGQITHIENITPTIMRVIITPDTSTSCIPGQYISITSNGVESYFSIANDDKSFSSYVFYMKQYDNNESQTRFLATFHEGALVELSLPTGGCHIESVGIANPLIMIAGGTGIVPIFAMLSYWDKQGNFPSASLIWGVSSEEDAFLHHSLDALFKKHGMSYQLLFNVPSLSDELISNANQMNIPKHAHMIISGHHEMAFKLRDAFHQIKKIPLAHFHSDAYSF
jgi:NAD(P)H-flavin reductase